MNVCMVLVVLVVTSLGEEVEMEDNIDTDETASSYKEEKNHSEAIQRILRDFEKTLEDNKKLFDKSDQETIESDDTNTTEPITLETEESVSETSSTMDNLTLSTTDSSTTRNKMVCNNSLSHIDDLLPQRSPNSTVQLVNGSYYQAVLALEYNSSVVNRTTSAICSLTLFFADWCDFSALAAPHYNALARAFPHMDLYAVDSGQHHSLNAHYGVMAVPTLLVFHNGRPLYKYNYTDYSLASFKDFVSLVTGLEPINVTEVTAEDMIGPVPSLPTKPHNLYLWLCLVFTLLCALLEFSRSPLAGQLLTGLRNAWREAEIQHEHEE